MQESPEVEEQIEMFNNNDEALMAYYILRETNVPIFLTGRAGSGKSTFIKLATTISATNYEIVAPTGIAALNVSGKTINSLFHLPTRFILPNDPVLQQIRFNKEDEAMLKSCDLLILDEISMVTSATLDCVNVVLQNVCKSTLPFAGKKVLFVGDPFQLPPVIQKEELAELLTYYESQYFFHAEVFEEVDPLRIELKVNYRQKDAAFIEILNNIGKATDLDSSILKLNQHCYTTSNVPAQEAINSINLSFTNKVADEINNSELEKIEGAAFDFYAEVFGEFKWDAVLAERRLTLKKGARVMFIKNHSQHLFVNGTMGVVQDIKDGKVLVRLDAGGILELGQEQWITEERRKTVKDGRTVTELVEVGSMRQYPIRLAWAITVHKSQGLTFDNVILNNGTPSFAYGQTYVAISRCKTLEGLRLIKRLGVSDIKIDQQIVNFYKKMDDPRVWKVFDGVMTKLETMYEEEPAAIGIEN